MRWPALLLAAGLAATAPAATTARPVSASQSAEPRVILLGIAVEAQPGYARVTEVVHLQNDTPHAVRARVSVPLPGGARYITFYEGLQQPAVRDGNIVDELIMRPGPLQIVYAYTVAGAPALSLDRRLAWPVERVEVLATAPAAARSPHLQPAPALERDGRTYTRATGQRVAPGPLPVTILGVPPFRRWPAAAAAATLAGLLALGLAWAVATGRNNRFYRA
jgi:hypothetical protein